MSFVIANIHSMDAHPVFPLQLGDLGVVVSETLTIFSLTDVFIILSLLINTFVWKYKSRKMEDIVNKRCGWAGTDGLYVKYHDEEWGRLVTEDKTLFEFLVLESAQAGLAWITILRKREGYRKAFYNFDVEKVAAMTSDDIDRLMLFDGIVRNRMKIASTITNARCFIAIQKEFGSFYHYMLSFFPGQKPIVNNFKSLKEIPVTTQESDAMSKDMKKRGFKFFGSTICYAHMQATGFVNDHLEGCLCKEKILTDGPV